MCLTLYFSPHTSYACLPNPFGIWQLALGCPFHPPHSTGSETHCWTTASPSVNACLLLLTWGTLTAIPPPSTALCGCGHPHHPAHCCYGSYVEAFLVPLGLLPHVGSPSQQIFFPIILLRTWNYVPHPFPSGDTLLIPLGLQKPVLGHCS